ncbi:MAG: tRNA (adenosine(37)-N6)-threonylcarbamoyltransferase complex ATPase subunit type 1 TsaE [Gammaproteobacteria bacterium]
MSESLKLDLADAAATDVLGRALATAISPLPETGLTIWLKGQLGAGKTTLVRALLRGLGHTGRVPSPTYTLVEPYELAVGPVHHVDLYRLVDPGEAEYLGMSELPAPGGLLLVEWPEQGRGFLPAADLELALEVAGHGRQVVLVPASRPGHLAFKRLAKSVN